MLTFEIADEGHHVEIHGDKKGLLKLANYLIGLADAGEVTHTHLMTENWGGSELDNERQGIENELINHVKVFLW